MTHTDAKRALQIVALSSAGIGSLAGCDCRNPQVQILRANEEVSVALAVRVSATLHAP